MLRRSEASDKETGGSIRVRFAIFLIECMVVMNVDAMVFVSVKQGIC